MGNIITSEDLRVEGIDSPPENPQRIEQLIADAEEVVESITKRLFYKRDGLTVYANGRGHESLRPEHPPIAITSIAVDDELVAATDYQIVTQPIGEQALFGPEIRRTDGSVWPKGTRNIKIVGSFGHVLPVLPLTDPVVYRAPALVRRLVALIVGHNLKTISEQVATSGRGEVVREKLGSAEFQYAEGTSGGSDWSSNKEIKQIIGRYQRLGIASV